MYGSICWDLEAAGIENMSINFVINTSADLLVTGLGFVLSKTGFGRTVGKPRFLPVNTGQCQGWNLTRVK